MKNVFIHLTLHSLLCLIAMVVIGLHDEVVEVLYNVFQLGLYLHYRRCRKREYDSKSAFSYLPSGVNVAILVS